MSDFELTAFNDYRRATIIDEPAHVETRLRALHPNLTPSILRDAITSGLDRRNEATPASAPTAAGVLQWLQTVHILRTILAALGWRMHQQQNCPFISSPDRSISLVVMTGNSETGRNAAEEPTNQAEKGAVAENFIYANSQLELFNDASISVARGGIGGTQVWALLYHYDKVLQEVRYELSLPTSFNRKKITTWGERILLGSISNNFDNFTIDNDTPNRQILVKVEPKSGIL